MKKLLLPIVAALLVLSTQQSVRSESEAGKVSKYYVKVDEQKRNFYLHLPPNYDPVKPYPLVVLLHGGGGNYERAIKITSFDRKADQEGFVLAVPNGSGFLKLYTWNSGNCCGIARRKKINDVAFIETMIKQIESRVNIDKNRIYVTGESNGGMLAYKLACEMSGDIAAIAPVAAGMDGLETTPTHPISVIAFNGTDDHTVLYDGGVGVAFWSRFRIRMKPVTYAMNIWRKDDKCGSAAQVEEHGSIINETYKGVGGSAVRLVTINGGKHGWPGGTRNWWLAQKPTQEISATDEIWDFFVQHPRVQSDDAKVATANDLGNSALGLHN